MARLTLKLITAEIQKRYPGLTLYRGRINPAAAR